jgi:hypothetical protein
MYDRMLVAVEVAINDFQSRPVSLELPQRFHNHFVKLALTV